MKFHDNFRFAEAYVSLDDLTMFLWPGDEKHLELTSYDDLGPVLEANSVTKVASKVSYKYVPSVRDEDLNAENRSQLGRESNDIVSPTIKDEQKVLIIYDKDINNHTRDFKNHAKNFNIVYLNGTNSSLGGIARTEPNEEGDDSEGDPKNNNGDGNNIDDVDMSNPGEAPKHADNIDNTVDDEKKTSGDPVDIDFDEYVDAINMQPSVTIPDDNKGNTIVADEDMDVTLEVVGSGYSSNTVKSSISVDGESYNWQDANGDDHTSHIVGVEGLSLELTLSEGSSIQVHGSAGHSSDDLQNSDNLKVYRNGDYASNLSGYDGQKSVKDFLDNYIDENGRVTIDDNQVIFLMELGTTNQTKSYYDMQDVVVLATFTPSTKAELEKMIENTVR